MIPLGCVTDYEATTTVPESFWSCVLLVLVVWDFAFPSPSATLCDDVGELLQLLDVSFVESILVYTIDVEETDGDGRSKIVLRWLCIASGEHRRLFRA